MREFNNDINQIASASFEIPLRLFGNKITGKEQIFFIFLMNDENCSLSAIVDPPTIIPTESEFVISSNKHDISSSSLLIGSSKDR